MHHLEVPIILVVIGTFVVLLAAAFLLRQCLVSRARGSFECSVRRRTLSGRTRWQNGLMRYGTDRLRWYRAFSVRLHPELTLRRQDIMDLARRPVDLGVDGIAPQTVVSLRLSDGSEIELLAERSAASGLLAWREAAPAGSIVSGTD